MVIIGIGQVLENLQDRIIKILKQKFPFQNRLIFVIHCAKAQLTWR